MPTFVVTARAECEARRISQTTPRDMILTVEVKNKNGDRGYEAVWEIYPRMAG
jgi:hypothetical protein